MTDLDIFIWIRGWDDTFTSIGKTREECRDWLAGRVAIWLKAARLEKAEKKKDRQCRTSSTSPQTKP